MMRASISPSDDNNSPANRQDLTPPYVAYAEHGKPVSPPKTPGKADRKEGS